MIIFKVVFGYGIEVMIDYYYILVGNCKLMVDNDISLFKYIFDDLIYYEWDGKIVMFIVVNYLLIGIIVVVDIVKDYVKDVIK